MRSIVGLSIPVLCGTAALLCSTEAFSIIPTTAKISHASRNTIMFTYSKDSNMERFSNNENAQHQSRPLTRSSTSTRQRIQQLGLKAWERMDTMKAAGLSKEGMAPLESGFKTNAMLLVGAFLFKWYRARFITKIPVWDRQPQWNMVVTSPEQEKELHAYQCKNCGATIFIARHREWFFKGGNTECTNCGAKGTENFQDVRDDVINSIDDDYFDYPSPLDFVSAAERRRLVKEAGGDEVLAKKIAIEKAIREDPRQVKIGPPEGEAPTASSGEGEKEKTGSKKKSAPKKEDPVDVLDELDMDF
ncbi:hypothetical protein HJC23_010007 [Cyclotella cryptica]|uniref:Rubredoxin-like domain-containing protein n=1 Tax=Cyclotella cryptica TaxID=29204 RepID=A0ABD3Q8M6_9STRA|eukprot:CCRYP_007783-RA/>CCRYP_007783-RA protein AED:0.03 eAED:0.03 QI:230/1/1/1/1/1/2/207/302